MQKSCFVALDYAAQYREIDEAKKDPITMTEMLQTLHSFST